MEIIGYLTITELSLDIGLKLSEKYSNWVNFGQQLVFFVKSGQIKYHNGQMLNK